MSKSNASAGKRVVEVAAGVIWGQREQILISLRAQHLDQGGFWEFPGGKREPGELPGDTLARELYEEIGIVVDIAEPLIIIEHDYPQKIVQLDVWSIKQWHGIARGREGQQVRWVSTAELSRFAFPPANVPIVTILQAPSGA